MQITADVETLMAQLKAATLANPNQKQINIQNTQQEKEANIVQNE